jgi:hypothetical protein
MVYETQSDGGPVPTLFRFLVVVLLLAGLGFAVIYALATFVEPQPREMTVTVPSNRLPSR